MGVRDNLVGIFEEQRALTDDEMQAYKDMLQRKEKAEQSQINTAENTDEIQSKPTATKSTEVPWWKGE